MVGDEHAGLHCTILQLQGLVGKQSNLVSVTLTSQCCSAFTEAVPVTVVLRSTFDFPPIGVWS